MTTDNEREFTVERVLVALDAACGNGGAVTAAAGVARRLGVMLAGLFIEDINLFRMMTLPVARHVSLISRDLAANDAAGLETELRALSRRAEEAIASAAAAAGVAWSFDVVRGDPLAQLLSATLETDLIVVGDLRPLPVLGLRLPTLAALPRVARRLPRSHLLLSRARWTPVRPVALVEVGSRRIRRVVDATLRLAGAPTGGAASVVDVIVVGGDEEGARAVVEAIREVLTKRQYVARVKRLTAPDAASLAAAAAAVGGDLVVLDVESPILDTIGWGEAEVPTAVPLLAVR